MNTSRIPNRILDTLIVSAGLASLVACAAHHTPRGASFEPTPGTLMVPEQTIYGEVPAAPVAAPIVTAHVVVYEHTPVTFVGARPVVRAHVETDAEHVARLMTATPEMVDCAACTPRKPFESMSGRVSRLGDR